MRTDSVSRSDCRTLLASQSCKLIDTRTIRVDVTLLAFACSRRQTKALRARVSLR